MGSCRLSLMQTWGIGKTVQAGNGVGGQRLHGAVRDMCERVLIAQEMGVDVSRKWSDRSLPGM